MVEQATHNRQVTGSNPVGAIVLISLLAGNSLAGVYAQGYTPSGLPLDDPNVQKNYVPLGIDEFRAPKVQEPLGALSADLVSVSDELVPGKPCLGCRAVLVRIKNGSSTPVIVEAEQAVLTASNLTALSENKILAQSGGQFSKKQIAVLAAVGFGTLGYCEPVVQDSFTTSKKDWTKSYGTDEIRRKLENLRLSRRIVLPDEETEGTIYFPVEAPLQGSVVIPLLTYPEGTSCGSLTIPVKQP